MIFMKRSLIIYWCAVALTAILFLGSGYSLFVRNSSEEEAQQSAEAESTEDDTEDRAYRMHLYEEQALSDTQEELKAMQEGNITEEDAISLFSEAKDIMTDLVYEINLEKESYITLLYYSAYLQGFWSENSGSEIEAELRNNALINAAIETHNYLVGLSNGSEESDAEESEIEEMWEKIEDEDIEELASLLFQNQIKCCNAILVKG